MADQLADHDHVRAGDLQQENKSDDEAQMRDMEVELEGGCLQRKERDGGSSDWVDLRGKPALMASTGGWKACIFIIGVEISERLTYYGIASNLITYLTTELHENISSAATNVNNWIGITTITPLLGGFVADAYFGRYWTIFAVSGVYFLGSFLLTLSASVPGLKPPRCMSAGFSCPRPKAQQVAFFYFSLYLISFGTGGLKPNLEALGADQFDELVPAEKLAKNSFFNWWYFGLIIGATMSSTFLVYVQDNVGWGWGFGISAIAITIATAAFCSGTVFYRHKAPTGSPLTSVAQVLVACVRKWNLSVPADSDELFKHENKNFARVQGKRYRLEHTNDFPFLDKAAIVSRNEVASFDSYNPWRLCTVTQVEEAKLILRVMPIWTTSLVYGILNAQVPTFFTKQGATLDNRMGPHFKVPPAAMQNVLGFTILTLLPIYDFYLVPLMRRYTKNVRGISMLQRLGFGLFFSTLSMIAAALAEKKRLGVARHHGLRDKPFTKVPMSIFELSPQYTIFGVADMLFIVGLQEFFYDQMPHNMRSMALGLYLSTLGVGSFLSSLCITILNNANSYGGHTPWISNNLNRSHLDYFYWFLTVLSFCNLCLFSLFALRYKYKQENGTGVRDSMEAEL